MKKFNQFLLAAVLMLFTTVAFAQATITGTVVDAETSSPLPGANVLEKGTSNGVTADFDGNFTITTNSTSGEIVISYVGFKPMTIAFNGDANLGNITLSPDSLDEVVVIGSGVIDLAEDRKTPVAVSTVRKDEIQLKGVGNVEVTEILKSTPSVFVSPGGGGFGDSALFVRGFDDTNTAVLLNGQPINAQEDGRVFWSNWQGVSDIANAMQVQRGLGASKLAISSVGGTVNIVMKAAEKQQGGSVRFLSGNDSYFKTTAEYNTGVNDKGWAFSFLIDHWQAHRSWARGTFGQGQNYFFAVGYKPNDNHAFNFLITGAPQYHGQRWSQSESTIDRDPKFNQHWGFTESAVNGQYTSEIDSERRNFYHKPVINLNWDWTISDKSSLSTVLYASFGRGGGTGPRGEGRIRTDDGQIDYFAIEQANEAIGVSMGGDDGPGYIRRASMNNHAWYGIVSNFNTELSENLSFNVGTDLRYYEGDHFRQIVDLYGLQGWEEDGVTYTETFEADPWAALFNFADEEDRIDYDYSETITYQGLFTQLEYSTDKFSTFIQGAVSNQSYVREGRHVSYTDANLGESDKLNKIGFNLKGGVAYSLDDANKFFFNAGYYSRQPYLDNVFENIRRTNVLVSPEVDNEDITGFEAGYQFKIGDSFTASANFYHTTWENRVLVGGGGTEIIDGQEVEVSFFERGINQKHIGAELDFVFRPVTWLRINGYLSAGSWKFEGSSTSDIFNEDTGDLITSSTAENRDGVRVPGIAQTTAGLSGSVNIIEGLSVDGGFNYFDNIYQHEFFADLQTRDVGRLDAYVLTDFGLTYTYKLGNNDSLVLRGNVFNAFDEVVLSNTDRFGFFNTDGRTYNVSLRYNF
ncbi:MAG: carboxypeptidase-like regulatory domain-containing protein [Bacteroidota bacterium]